MWAKVGKALQVVDRVWEKLAAGRYSGNMNSNGAMFLVDVNAVTDKLIELPDSHVSVILRRIESFFNKAPLYQELGDTHKFTVLLKGPPGTGKTSILNLAAAQFVRQGGVVISLSRVHVVQWGEVLRRVRDAEPNVPILALIENVEKFQCPQLESFLEGEDTIDGLVVLATTNYYNSIQAQFRRPGRFDLTLEVGLPTAALRDAYLRDKLPKLNDAERLAWVEKTSNFSIAHLAALKRAVVYHEADLDAEISRFRELELIPIPGGKQRLIVDEEGSEPTT